LPRIAAYYANLRDCALRSSRCCGCLPGPLDPKAASPGLIRLLARAADVPDLATLEAYLFDTEAKVRKCRLVV
jgi:hypothetical protein